MSLEVWDYEQVFGSDLHYTGVTSEHQASLVLRIDTHQGCP